MDNDTGQLLLMLTRHSLILMLFVLFPFLSLMACWKRENGGRKAAKGKGEWHQWKEPFGRNQATEEKKGNRREEVRQNKSAVIRRE